MGGEHSLSAGSAQLGCEERMLGKDEQRAAAGAAEYDVGGTLGHVDAGDLLACRIVDEDLSVGNVDVPFAIDCDAFAAAVGERLQIMQGSVSGD